MSDNNEKLGPFKDVFNARVSPDRWRDAMSDAEERVTDALLASLAGGGAVIEIDLSNVTRAAPYVSELRARGGVVDHNARAVRIGRALVRVRGVFPPELEWMLDLASCGVPLIRTMALLPGRETANAVRRERDRLAAEYTLPGTYLAHAGAVAVADGDPDKGRCLLALAVECQRARDAKIREKLDKRAGRVKGE